MRRRPGYVPEDAQEVKGAEARILREFGQRERFATPALDAIHRVVDAPYVARLSRHRRQGRTGGMRHHRLGNEAPDFVEIRAGTKARALEKGRDTRKRWQGRRRGDELFAIEPRRTADVGKN